MKRILGIVLALVLFAVPAFAASSMTPNLKYYESEDRSITVIEITCTAHTDGTFDSYELADTASMPYYKRGYYLLDAWAVNSATDDHTNAAVVTITDATGRVIVGTASGDTLTLSQAASGVAYLSASRSAAQRSVTSALTTAIADTGSTATVQTLYLVLGR